MMMLSRLPASSRRKESGVEARARHAASTVASSPPVAVSTLITPSACETTRLGCSGSSSQMTRATSCGERFAKREGRWPVKSS